MHKNTHRQTGVTNLHHSFLHGDLMVDTTTFLSTHCLQLFFVQGKQLGSSQDPQTINSPAETVKKISYIFIQTNFLLWQFNISSRRVHWWPRCTHLKALWHVMAGKLLVSSAAFVPTGFLRDVSVLAPYMNTGSLVELMQLNYH